MEDMLDTWDWYEWGLGFWSLNREMHWKLFVMLRRTWLWETKYFTPGWND